MLLILARLLVPSEFGIASIVIAVAIFVPLFADLGLGAALVQAPKITELDRSTVFWTSLPLGMGFMTLGIALSWPLASLYDEPSLQPLFAAFSSRPELRQMSAETASDLSRRWGCWAPETTLKTDAVRPAQPGTGGVLLCTSTRV